MRQLRRLPSAIRDLDQVWLYIAQHDADAAQRLIDDIDRASRKLLDYPHLGPAKPEAAADMRVLKVRRYNILYRVTEQTIDLVRVVHQARDINQINLD
jgi:toxin ParE1/3/4